MNWDLVVWGRQPVGILPMVDHEVTTAILQDLERVYMRGKDEGAIIPRACDREEEGTDTSKLVDFREVTTTRFEYGRYVLDIEAVLHAPVEHRVHSKGGNITAGQMASYTFDVPSQFKRALCDMTIRVNRDALRLEDLVV